MLVEEEIIAALPPLDEAWLGRERFTSPAHWGLFFYDVKGYPDMKEVNLLKWYRFGEQLSLHMQITSGETMMETWMKLTFFDEWPRSFLGETIGVPIPRTRQALIELKDAGMVVHDRLLAAIQNNQDAPITVGENVHLHHLVKIFEREFEHEARDLAIFAVTPKGDLDTRILIEDAAKKFDANLLAVMPDRTKEDIGEAGRCLAFERATACAFHICRATEGLMRTYYKHLTGNDWPPPAVPPKKPMNKDWKVLVDQLRVEGAPKSIYTRLDEIRDDRNAYAHPDVIVPLDEAPIVYDLCTGVMFYMAKEMV
jgi:hypothetical protein